MASEASEKELDKKVGEALMLLGPCILDLNSTLEIVDKSLRLHFLEAVTFKIELIRSMLQEATEIVKTQE